MPLPGEPRVGYAPRHGSWPARGVARPGLGAAAQRHRRGRAPARPTACGRGSRPGRPAGPLDGATGAPARCPHVAGTLDRAEQVQRLASAACPGSERLRPVTEFARARIARAGPDRGTFRPCEPAPGYPLRTSSGGDVRSPSPPPARVRPRLARSPATPATARRTRDLLGPPRHQGHRPCRPHPSQRLPRGHRSTAGRNPTHLAPCTPPDDQASGVEQDARAPRESRFPLPAANS